MKPSQKTYLLLLHYSSAEASRQAIRLCREMNLRVPAVTGSVALEVTASADEADRLFRTGMFALCTCKAIRKEHVEKLNEHQREAASAWNHHFSAGYRKLKADKSKRGLSFGDPKRKEPAPYIEVEVADFEQYLQELIRSRNISVKTVKPKLKLDSGKPSAPQFRKLRQFIHTYVPLETDADILARIFYKVNPKLQQMFLDPDLLDLLWEALKGARKGADAEDSCWKMHGKMSVGLVFVESSKSGGPKFTDSVRNDIINEVKSGLSWLVSQHPSGNLSWVYDIQKIKIDVANKSNGDDSDSAFDSYWRFPAMGKVSYQGNTYASSDTGVDDYREDMRQHDGSEHAFVIFVTPYGTSWHAYSSGKRFIVLAEHGNDWGGWGRDCLNAITAHEVCHKFGAADEYTGNGTPCSSCGGEHGCDKIPNGNCDDCAAPSQDCVMDGNDLRICAYTKGQIGWADIFVELWTEDESWAGTDDTVWLDIGERTFTLDNPNHDDRERGNREGYALWAGGDLSRSSIQRILIRKESDGFAGGWKLKRVKVYHDGEVICDQSPHKWLEDNDLWWVGCTSADSTLVNKLKVKVTTADVSWAGTDDDVTLKLAGRSWNLDNDGNDFERGDTNTFNLDPKTGLHISDITTVTITKSSDGVAGGWKLKGIQLIVNDVTIYNNQSINKWLEDDDRTWSDGI